MTLLKIRMIKLGIFTDSASSIPEDDVDEDDSLLEDIGGALLNHMGKNSHKRLGMTEKKAKPIIMKSPSF